MRNRLILDTGRAIVLGLSFFAITIQTSAQPVPTVPALSRLEAKMQTAIIQRPVGQGTAVAFEVALPRDADETKKMNGNALLLIRSSASAEEEVKIAAAYVEEAGSAHQLTRIGKSGKKITSPDGFQEDSLYFIPLRLLSAKYQVAVLLQKTALTVKVGSLPPLEATTAGFLTGRESELSMSFRSSEWKKLASREFPGIDFSMKRSIDEVHAYLTKQVPPHYPADAIRQQITGSVILRVLIDGTGKVKGIYLIEGHPVLARAAADAVRQWQYRPYTVNGQYVDLETQEVINFDMGG